MRSLHEARLICEVQHTSTPGDSLTSDELNIHLDTHTQPAIALLQKKQMLKRAHSHYCRNNSWLHMHIQLMKIKSNR